MNKILIVIDAQNDFIDCALGSDEAIKAIPNIVKKIENDGYDCIITTRDTHAVDYLDTREGKNLPVEHCVFGTEGWQINWDVMNAIKQATKSYFNVDKPTFGSYKLVDMVTRISENWESLDIDVIGFCTDICVVSNVLMLKAKLYEKANITVDAECCAGVTPEKHRAALEVMKSCQVNVVNDK